MHFALGTNKFSSSIGTAFSTGRYIKNGYVDWKLGIPSIVLALIGSFFGTKLQLMISEVYLQYLLLIVLPVVAFVVLRQRQLPEERGDIEPKKQMAIVYLAALVVGAYDGFYGPGHGHVPASHFLQSRQARRAHSGRQCQARESVFQHCLAPDQPVKRQGLPRPRPHRHGVEHPRPFHRRGTRHKNGSKIVKPAIILVLILLAAKVVQGQASAFFRQPDQAVRGIVPIPGRRIGAGWTGPDPEEPRP